MDEHISNTIIELMILKAADGIKGRSRLQNIVFLLKEKYKIPIEVNYKMYFYGPYSEDLTYDIKALEAFGLLKEETEYEGGYIEYRYKLTERGEELLSKFLREERNKELYEKIQKSVKELLGLSSGELIREAKSVGS